MPLEQHPTKPDMLVFRGHPSAMLSKSATIERARSAAKMLRKRNESRWDETDREIVFAIDALVAHAEWLRVVRSTSNPSQE